MKIQFYRYQIELESLSAKDGENRSGICKFVRKRVRQICSDTVTSMEKREAIGGGKLQH